MLFLCPLRSAAAQEAPISAVAFHTSVSFGSPVILSNGAGSDLSTNKAPLIGGTFGEGAVEASAGARYMERGASLSIQGQTVVADGEGIVLFVQRNPLFAGDMPPAAGNFIALAHRDGFVSIFSGKQFVSADSKGRNKIGRGEVIGSVIGTPGSQTASYVLQVYDGAGGLWVNPAFFIPGIEDRAAPKIEQLVLVDQSKKELSIEPGKKGTVSRIAQGKYSLAVHVFDPETRIISKSGIFSFKAILDGQVILDRKLDSARSTNKGLAFLGMNSPSSSLIDSEGRILLGENFIPRGAHSLEFFVSDFAGNVSSLKWKFTSD